MSRLATIGVRLAAALALGVLVSGCPKSRSRSAVSGDGPDGSAQRQVAAVQAEASVSEQREAMPWEEPEDTREAEKKIGLHLNDPGAFQGYTLFAPCSSTTTFLIGMMGRSVQTTLSLRDGS